MRAILSSFIILAGVLSTSAAQAELVLGEGKPFAGLMLGTTRIDTGELRGEPITFTARGGYDFNRFVGLEARVARSLKDEVRDSDVEVNYLVSALARLGWETADRRIGLHGLVGYTTLKIEESLGGFSDDETDGGISYGVTIDLFADERNGVNIEYLRYLEPDDLGTVDTITHIGVGYVRRF